MIFNPPKYRVAQYFDYHFDGYVSNEVSYEDAKKILDYYKGKESYYVSYEIKLIL